ncbi:MAG TPA: hypothetical protein ENH43_00570 [Phycisphaerales bacterium]|nr:hypothetical protein [Phycisphaerales bacterium]
MTAFTGKPKATKQTDQVDLLDAAKALKKIIPTLSGTAAIQAAGLEKHCQNLAKPPKKEAKKPKKK